MLVLSRKLDEQIVIGESVFITIVGMKDGTVRLGIDAPPEVPVNRREVFDRMIERDGRVTPGGHPSRDPSRERDISRDPSPPHGPARTSDRAGMAGGPSARPASVNRQDWNDLPLAVPPLPVGGWPASDGLRVARPAPRLTPEDREREIQDAEDLAEEYRRTGTIAVDGDRDRGCWGYPEGIKGGGA